MQLTALQTRLFRVEGRFAVGVDWNNGSQEIHPVRWQSLAAAQAAADRFREEGMRGWKALL